MGFYILDFYCPISRVAIEVDGQAHNDIDVIRHDERRTRWLSRRGIKVLRFNASDILSDEALEGVLREIESMLAAAPSVALRAPPPPQAGEDPDTTVPGSSPAKRGRGTMRSMVEGACSRSTSPTICPTDV
jgi:hypothetical protein